MPPPPPDELIVWLGHDPVMVTLVPATRLGVAVPVPPLATGKRPVTPVVSGKPVVLVKVPDEGVPRAPPGATKSVPAVAAVNADVPLPLSTPVSVVAPVPPLPTGKVPVTPVDRGRPVKLVAVPDDGVPKAPPLVRYDPAGCLLLNVFQSVDVK